MTGSWTTVKTPDGAMETWRAAPAGGGKKPAVIVAQEAFGVNSHIRDVAERFAAEGFVAAAPELFHRSGTHLEAGYDEWPKVRGWMGALSTDGIESDLEATIAHLKASADVDAAKIGVVGYCMGGYCAFLAACRLPVAAAVSYYGGGIVTARAGGGMKPLIGEASRIKAPVLAFFGGKDQSISLEDAEALKKRLAELSPKHEVIVYPEAGHGFFCDQRASYDAKAAKDSWPKVLARFRAM